jgi:hypothetical protein
MKTFTFYWRDGSRDVLSGADPADALNRAGFGAGAVRALDFHASGDNQEWEWRDKDWRPKEGSELHRLIEERGTRDERTAPSAERQPDNNKEQP